MIALESISSPTGFLDRTVYAIRNLYRSMTAEHRISLLEMLPELRDKHITDIAKELRRTSQINGLDITKAKAMYLDFMKSPGNQTDDFIWPSFLKDKYTKDYLIKVEQEAKRMRESEPWYHNPTKNNMKIVDTYMKQQRELERSSPDWIDPKSPG